MKIKYTIEDGYIGGGTHTVNIEEQDLQDCSNLEEVEALIDSEIEEHFRQNIYPVWDRSQLSKISLTSKTDSE